MNQHTNALLIIAVTTILLVMIMANITIALAIVILIAIIVLTMIVGRAAQYIPAVIRAALEGLFNGRR